MEHQPLMGVLTLLCSSERLFIGLLLDKGLVAGNKSEFYILLRFVITCLVHPSEHIVTSW